MRIRPSEDLLLGQRRGAVETKVTLATPFRQELWQGRIRAEAPIAVSQRRVNSIPSLPWYAEHVSRELRRPGSGSRQMSISPIKDAILR